MTHEQLEQLLRELRALREAVERLTDLTKQQCRAYTIDAAASLFARKQRGDSP